MSQGPRAEKDPWLQFTALMRTLVQVPKAEVDAAMVKWKARKKGTKPKKLRRA